MLKDMHYSGPHNLILKKLEFLSNCYLRANTFFHLFLSKETYEEKNRLLKERLDRIFSGNERRCSRAPMYGRDLLGICSLIGEQKPFQLSSCEDNSWRWAGFVNCCLSSSASRGPSDPLQEMIQTLVQQQESLRDVVNR